MELVESGDRSTTGTELLTPDEEVRWSAEEDYRALSSISGLNYTILRKACLLWTAEGNPRPAIVDKSLLPE